MSDAEDNPFLITPPPGAAPKPPEPEPTAPPADPEAFITLPPGVVDSATFRVANPRVATPPTERQSDDIVFFSAPIGAPVPTAPAPVTSADEAAEADEAQAEVEETSFSVPRHAVPAWRLVLPGDSGRDAVDVREALFIGRNPTRTPEWPQAELLAAVDPAKSLSKTHALLEVESGVLWVHDLNSTNGVFVVLPNGDAIEVEPGTRTTVPAGADLELGDYVIRVERS